MNKVFKTKYRKSRKQIRFEDYIKTHYRDVERAMLAATSYTSVCIKKMKELINE